METKEKLFQALKDNQYKLVTQAEFSVADDVPEGIRERASTQNGAYVVYDPEDDEEDWLLVGDDATALAQETYAERIDWEQAAREGGKPCASS